MNLPPAPTGHHDLVAHLFAASLDLMHRHGQPFLPLETVRERLGWSEQVLGDVVDHCVEADPVSLGDLKAEWMDDGERPAFGASGKRFISIRPAARA
ncbi:MAG TPA: hypothetical protein VML96_12730 [Egibacteraceae bacterium]|nr:hypothetical protein [Egibacteraceae bacterium]